MTIIILRSQINNDDNGSPQNRSCYIYIANNGEAYMYNVGGLPLAGSLQTILNAQEAELFTAAQANGQLPTSTELEIVGAIGWYLANSGTKAAVFDKTITQENTDITALIAASFPSLGAGFRAAWLQLLMSALLDTRVNAHDRNLV